MRGDLDDALARLRRWDEVRQRLASSGDESAPEPPPAPTPGPVFHETVDAIGQVLRRYPHATVTVTVREADASWGTQVTWGIDGRPSVAPPTLDEAAADPLTGPVPATGSPAAIAPTSGEPAPPPGPASTAPGLPARAAGNLGPAPRLGLASGLGKRRAVREQQQHQDQPEHTAARLADLIRRDPSLLDPPDEPVR
jgi:hypothetical protein